MCLLYLQSSQRSQMSSVLVARFVDKAGEGRIWIAEEVAWGIILCDLAIVHHEDSITLNEVIK
jgi:hypothetical protein